MLARRDLGNDAAGVHDARVCDATMLETDAAAVVDHRDAGLVARGLDREDAHSVLFELRAELREPVAHRAARAGARST